MQKFTQTIESGSRGTSIAAWNLMLVLLFSFSLYVWLPLFGLLRSTLAPSAETLIPFVALTFLLCVLLWNLICIAVAYATVIRFLPRSVKRFLQTFIHSCGTEHSKKILRQRMLRGALAGTLLGSAAVHGAFATPLLPTPDVSPSPSVGSSAPVDFSQDSPPVLLPTPTQGAVTRGSTTSHVDQHTVVIGESLWSITESSWPDASVSELATKVDELYHLNKDIIGSDPDLIHPGMQLTLSTDVKELP